MKTHFHYIAFVALGMLSFSCEHDNYEAPGSTLQGRIVYEGEPVPVSYNDVTFELWEPGWQQREPITVTVDQDGSYSALLFNATYKIHFQPNQGPFMIPINPETNSDTIIVNVQGSQTVDIEVLPYYMVRDAGFSLNGSTVSATCRLEQVITDDNARDVERVSLYLAETQFVDGRTQISQQTLNGGDIADLNAISLSADVPAMTPAQDHIFARIGLKIAGVEDMIFSAVEKIEL